MFLYLFRDGSTKKILKLKVYKILILYFTLLHFLITSETFCPWLIRFSLEFSVYASGYDNSVLDPRFEFIYKSKRQCGRSVPIYNFVNFIKINATSYENSNFSNFQKNPKKTNKQKQKQKKTPKKSSISIQSTLDNSNFDGGQQDY